MFQRPAISRQRDYSLSATLYQSYAPRLFAYFCRHVPTGEDAEDLLLEVFLAALKHEHTLATRQEDEQRAWLWTVARNKVRDFHKRVAHRYHFVVLEQATEVMDDGQNAPEAILLRKEAHSHLHMQLQSLSTRQREILQLHFTGGLNCVEIAAVLRKREGTVRTMLSRALNRLRNMYKNEGTN